MESQEGSQSRPISNRSQAKSQKSELANPEGLQPDGKQQSVHSSQVQQDESVENNNNPFQQGQDGTQDVPISHSVHEEEGRENHQMHENENAEENEQQPANAEEQNESGKIATVAAAVGEDEAEGQEVVQENETGEKQEGEEQKTEEEDFVQQEEAESPEIAAKREEFELESDPCIAYLKEKIELDSFNSDMWTIDHSRLLKAFITDPNFNKLFFWVDQNGLRYNKIEPPTLTADEYDTDFLYFVKNTQEDSPITMINIETMIHCGIIGTDDLKYLLKVMRNQFIPAFVSDQSWPDNVKKDFVSQMHKFMASITEAAFQREHTIRLYIPNEDLSDKQAVMQDKDLIQRLESILLQWSKQIKEIVNNQEIQNDSELAGPLDEIEYWKSRQKNLSFLNEQLNSQELKKIVDVLQMTESTYLKGFQNLSNQINEGYLEAEDNLKYLKSLQEPCRKLEESSPRDIPEILPQLLQRVRMISEYSKFYNNKDRIAGLLRKISNEIIKRCKAQINLKELLEGDVEKCMDDLNDSINCGNKWRTIYTKTEELIRKKSKGKGVWDFNQKSIFAQIDAFVQRCLDLKEICEGQMQFARKGGDSQMPIFGGTKGREIISLLEENRVRFKKLLDKIKDSDQDLILDIKSTKWHDDYNNFKNGMKDLDNMYESIINHSFESISTIEQGVEMLEAFDSLARRSSIKQSVQNKAQYIFQLFDQEVNKAKQEFDNTLNHPEMFHFTYGKHSGKAIWVRSMLHRLDKLKISIDKMNFVGDNDMKKDCMKNFEQVYNLFKNYLKEEFSIWKDEVAHFDTKVLEDCLQNPVLFRAGMGTVEGKKAALAKVSSIVEKYKPKEDQLENNFDKQLMRLITEASGWFRFSNQFTHLGIIIPEHIRDFVNVKKENLRVYRDQVMRVVREYNQIIDEMEEPVSHIETKKLFDEHLKDTNRALEAGLKRIRFSVKSELVLEGQVNDWLRSCRDLHGKLKTFKANNALIHKKCKEISDLQFIELDKRNAIELTKFEEDQERCRKRVSAALKQTFEDIKKILDETYHFFYKQSDKIQTLWFKYVANIDHEIEKSLKKAIRLSLVEINKTLNGDSKTEATPIFKVSVVLINGNPSFSPSTDTLQKTVRETMAAITELTSSLLRMEQQMFDIRKGKEEQERLTKEALQAKMGMRKEAVSSETLRALPDELVKKKIKSFYDTISGDKEIGDWTNKILSELEKSCKGLQELLNPWLKDTLKIKDKSEKKFAHSMVYDRNEPLNILISELENFDKIQAEIQENSKSTEKHHCIQLDNTIIKAQIIDKLILFQNNLLNTMQEKTIQELNHLYSIVQNSVAALGPYPYELSQLRMNIEVWEEWTKKKPLFEVDLNALEEKFKFLDKSLLQLKKEDAEKRDQLRKEWENFLELLDTIQQRNAKRFADMKNETIKTHEEFNKESDDMRNKVFSENAPYSATNLTNERAFILLNEFKDQVRQLRRKEEEMNPAFALFKMSPAPNADLDFVDKEIQSLEMVWGLKEDWDQKWERELKKIKFKEIDTDALEEIVDEFRGRINEFPKEIKKWDVVKYLWDVLDQFLKTLPLINKLKHPSMRQRHWSTLKTGLGRSDLDHESETFNLGEVYNLKLNQYPDIVENITEAARAQFQIENTLEVIKNQWDNQEIDMERYKKDYWKIKKPEDIFTLLEEHMVTLASMKTNTFFYVFENQITELENTLTRMLETLELLMTVQRQWIYLNSIFESQKDGKAKQLIGDNSRFKAQTKHFIGHLERINNDRNAMRALIYDRFAQELTEISKNLEEIQKILLQLLEMKRKDFPRFYFLSNDDLFELLGNSRDPSVVNKHMKKLFEGIKALDISIQQPKGGKQEILGMISPEGEKVEFSKTVVVDNEVDRWLGQVQETMRTTLKVILLKVTESIKPKETKWIPAWIHDFPGQLLLLALQMRWTRECSDALNKINTKIADRAKAWQSFKLEQRRMFEELTKLVRKVTNDNDRLKLVALITVMIHTREVVEVKLFKNCQSPHAFEWQSQLRFEQISEGSEALNCRVEQMNFAERHGFEYQGNNGRLVVTNLTDRCYLTLTTAMHLIRGGAPQGPAGTGKTETVKDLGKSMGKFVLVFNCSEGLEYSSLGRMFSGLVQTGGWGCFDEFNRIEVEVLSVIATQISTIFQALRLYHSEGTQSFFFETHEIGIDPSCGIFITMNPGYAGRSELPDNLKSMFRPISMVVPNSDVIAHTLLSAEGFTYGDKLSKKIITLYDLMVKQLSKQDHYDFGLRAVKSVLTAAGRYRRTQGSGDEKKDKEKDQGAVLDFQLSEEERVETMILMRAIRDMNLPKFVAEDIVLFNALFNVIFQVSEMPTDVNEALQNAIYDVMSEEGYQQHAPLVTKVIQLNESKDTRHGNMLVGSTLSGKTTCWKILQKALNKLNKDNSKKFPAVRITHLNPKSIDIKELYGYVNPDTAEWYEGVLSYQMAAICKEESSDHRWMILDGPVDTIWIESMNTVLDDNKVLTLLNGDRIGLPPEVSLIFEVEDLSVASPATVSRCGMVFMDINELGWKPYVDSWIDKKKDPELRAYLDELFYKWIRPLLETKRKFCKELVPCTNVNLVISLCKVLDALNATEVGLKFDDPPKSDEYWLLLEKWFAFALLWSVGGTVTEESRKLIDSKFRDIESFFPANNIYDYYINTEKSDWAPWEEKLTSVWKPPANTPFHKLIVPTVDTYRNRYILQTLVKAKALILVVGITGTGKTSIINSLLGSLDDTYTSFYMNFSAQTTSVKTQEIIESKLVRRAKGKMTPDAGKKGIIFIDDLNMPRKDQFGSQPPLELIRQYIEYGGWYDRQSLDIFKVIDNVQFIAAMGPPGGGRAEISQRLQSKFNTINFTFPSDTQVKRIFQSILSSQLNNLDEEIRPLTDPLASATINLYLNIQSTFLPTPTKAHYIFNMRDISKVIQGVCQIEYCDTKLSLIKVWVHESLRVFYDRLVSEEDRMQLKKLIGDRLELELGSNLKDCSHGEDDTVFVDFIDEDNTNYQEVTDREKLQTVVKAKLDNYNETIRGAPLNIVMFKEAILNLCKIYRIIKLSRGHGLLIGEGGSGRHSLTRLAAFICGYKPFNIRITKNYDGRQFREDLKKFCEEIGTKRTPGVFLFSDNEILQESFIEDINSLISSGEVPNLFKKEEMTAIRDKCRKEAKNQKIETEEGIWEFFLNKVQSNLHIMLCMSKTGDNLRNYTRMYPGLINNTTMVWFMPWPQEALYEVADHYLATLTDVDANSKKSMSTFFSDTHMHVLLAANKMWMELKRMYYVTATNYIELVQGYLALLSEKRKEVGHEINKLNLGLEKLAEAGRNMEELSVALDHAHNDLTQKQKDCEELMIRITHESREADDKQKEVEAKTAVLEKDRIETETLANSAKADLDAAMPALMEASEKIDKLTNSEFAEIKAYSTPPEPVMAVMSVIMIFLGMKDVSWASAKSALSDPNFVSNLKDFSQNKKNEITIKTLNKVEKYSSRADMSPADVRKISSAAGTLWEWCLAMEKYAKAWRDIEPKRNNVRKLEEKLRKNEDELHVLEEKFQQLKDEVDKLKNRYEQANDDKEKFKNDAHELRIKLERAEKLVYSLSSSKERWASDKRKLQEQYDNLIGDTLISAALLSYAGPFPSEYRERLVSQVMLPNIKSMKIPFSRFYVFADFLAKPTDIQRWNGQGLPTDNFSVENGVIVVKSRRWPLMIDPQMQANKWIKSMEREKLILLDPQTDGLKDKIERAIIDGSPVLLQNLGEDIDPSLDPVLNKVFKKIDGRLHIVLGENAISYNPNFKLYMTTKFSNPKYKAEVSTKVTLVNFTVKEKGLEEQLLGKLIENLEPELEKRKNELVQKTAKNQAKLKESDEEVLRLLMETKGSLVDDDNLVTKLQNSKATEDEIKQQIESSSQTMKKTLALRENYRPLGTMASHLFFVLNDLNKIDHMYQFSLESYIDLFVQAIPKKEERHMMLDTLQSKLDIISERHKIGVYKYACRSLFEKDKILLSMQMTAKLSDKVNPEEYTLFLRGVGTVDRSQQPPNPAPEWITQGAWDAINALDKIPKFDGLVGSFMNSTKEWRRWYTSEAPETEVLPGEWSNRFDTPLRMMILLKSMRPDRVMLACREFVEKGLGDKFVNPPEANFEKVYEDSKPSTPIVVILSPGVDPYPQVEALAQRLKIPLYPLSLGQGQSDRAKDKIGDGVKNGHWVFLANCHLSISFLAELEKLLEKLRIDDLDPSNKFRLWLTTNPHPKFSISILQKSIKVTTEPPRGLKANMLRLYTQMQEEQFKVDDKQNYKKLLFCLCWFHSVIIERKRFKSLGWNVSYDFNDSDFQICENIIKNYLDKSARGVDESAKIIPWDAIRYLIYEINYGGRVTDECDRTLLRVYANEFFNERVITEENFNLADPNLEFQYIVPDDEGWKPPQDKGKELQFKSQTAYFFETEIRKYPDIDPPGAFSQHINAVISSQIADTNILIESILSLQPRETSQGTESMELVVEKIVNDLKEKVPEIIPMEEVEERNKNIPDDDPYKIVMKQEISRYNKLIVTLEASLKSLLDGIQGRILISEDLEKIMESLYESKVPKAWKFTYPSLKPLNSWIVDLNARMKEFRDWALKGQPMVFWISYFTYPKGFLTAILQQTARRLPKVSIDMLGLDFYFVNTENVTKAATEGVYVRGLYLEGAKWDWNKSILIDAEPMTLHDKMPIMQFRPIITEGKKQKKGQNIYSCPTYMYPVRGDASFVLYINLPCGALTDPSFWVKRGTALLMSLSD